MTNHPNRNLTLSRISHRDAHAGGRYLVCEDSPDDGGSTFAECWGQNAKYAYRAIETTDSLSEARALVTAYGVIMDTVTGRPV